jgi:hypothetical protein
VPTTQGSRQRTPRTSPLKRPAPCPPASPSHPRLSLFITRAQLAVAELASPRVCRHLVSALVALVFVKVSSPSVLFLYPTGIPSPLLSSYRLRLGMLIRLGQRGATTHDQRDRHGAARAARSPAPPPVRPCPRRGPSWRGWRSSVASAALVPAQSCARSVRSAQHPS